jgi:hypothetical protein
VKKVVAKKELSITEKRLILVGSAKRNISAKRLLINQPNVRTRATIVKREQNPVKEEPVDANDSEELPELEEILRSAGKKM